jgi:hypothetical protein
MSLTASTSVIITAAGSGAAPPLLRSYRQVR